MRTEVAEKWIAALESGEFEQGQGSLNREGKFCCLGVLCEIAVREGVMTDGHLIEVKPDIFETDMIRYDDQSAYLPASVREWAGLKNDYGMVDHDGVDLVAENDQGTSFADIANEIRNNMEEL